MTEAFLEIVNMSISASWIVLAVLVFRLLLKKAPKWINVMLWGIVAVRLICPFSFESALSLMPSTRTINPEFALNSPVIDSGVPVIDSVINPVLSEAAISLQPEKDINFFQFIMPYIAGLWLLGTAVLLCYTFISYLVLKRKIGTAVLLRDNIYQCEAVVSPFVLGIIRPKIYLPFNTDAQDIEHIIAHEAAHIRRWDHIWKPTGFLILTVHWFNPLMWLGYVLLCRDIELACDQRVVKEFDAPRRADYSQALLNCSVNRRLISACPLAFGEVGVKGRVRSVLNYKKPAFWVIAVAITVSIITAVCFLTNPESKESGIGNQTSSSDLSGVSLEIISSDLSSPDPFLEVKWKNETAQQLIFGNAFSIYYNDGGNWEYCGIDENPIWLTIGYLLRPYGTAGKTYKLSRQLMTRAGTYRLEARFHIDGKSEQDYMVWLEFELKEGVENIAVRSFKAEELVYDNGSYSFVQTAENTPVFMLAGSMELFTKQNGRIAGPLGYFEEINPNYDNFDSRFQFDSEYSWLSEEAFEKLKSENKRAWQLCANPEDEILYLYLLLEQKDGTYYMGYGYYNRGSTNPLNSDDSHIRWLYRLSEELGDNEVSSSAPLSIYTGEAVTQPPALVVVRGDKSIEALTGTSSWIYEKEDGTAEGIMTDSNHPLMMKEITPVLGLTASYWGRTDESEVILHFNAKGTEPEAELRPDEISIACWKEKHWGDTAAESEEITYSSADGNIILKLKDGNYIYEITAVWSSNRKFSGTVRYSFCTEDMLSEEEISLIPMVMIDGVFYLDTGFFSKDDPENESSDGEINSMTPASRKPFKNNQSNFGTGYKYRYGSAEDTVEIKMNGKWRIFATEEARQKLQFGDQ